MNLPTLIILTVLAFGVVAALVTMHRRGVADDHCRDCALRGLCPKKKK